MLLSLFSQYSTQHKLPKQDTWAPGGFISVIITNGGGRTWRIDVDKTILFTLQTCQQHLFDYSVQQAPRC